MQMKSSAQVTVKQGIFTDAGETEWHETFIMATDTVESPQVAFTMRSIQPTNSSSQVWDGLASSISQPH